MLNNRRQQSNQRIHDVWNNLKCDCYTYATQYKVEPFKPPKEEDYGGYKKWHANKCSCIVAQNKYKVFDKNSYGNTIFGNEVPENVKNGWRIYNCNKYVSEIKYDGFL